MAVSTYSQTHWVPAKLLRWEHLHLTFQSVSQLLCEVQPGEQVIRVLVQTWTPCACNAICPLNDLDFQTGIVMSVETSSNCTAAG